MALTLLKIVYFSVKIATDTYIKAKGILQGSTSLAKRKRSEDASWKKGDILGLDT